MLKWALKYREMGFSVIPLRPKAKEPLIPWTEYQKRIASEAEIKSWFCGAGTAPNVGIVTGAVSSLAVVDLDGSPGLESGKRLGLTSPVSVLTGNGMQLYYRATTEIPRNSVRALGDGLDIRGEGGYVAAPPSLHPNGKHYRWLSSPLARHLLSEFPGSLLTPSQTSAPSGAQNERGWIAAALAGMRQGNIDDTLFKVCSRLRADGYAPEDARLLLAPHAERVGATAGHLDDKIANVWRRYEANPQATATITRVGKAEGLSEFLQDKQEVEWICHPIIAKKSIGFVAGLPETSKTWLLIDLAVAMSGAGLPWLGLLPTAFGRVLFIDQERFKGETQRRFAAVIAEKGLAPSENLFIKCGTDIKLNDDRSFELFREELLTLKPDIVMVDSFATFHNVPENNRMEIQNVLNRIKALRDEIGCAFVFINHESKMVFQDVENNEKPSAFRMMGSVGIVAAAEFCLTVRKMADGSSIVHHTKSSLAASSKSFFVSVVDTARGIAVKGVA
jgi:hypothetical protein